MIRLPWLVLSVVFFVSSLSPAESRTYRSGDNWVTKHTKAGGRIEDITGLVWPTTWAMTSQFEEVQAEADLPQAFDWRERTPFGLQPIRNQKSCGSCWAFSVTAVLESLWVLTHTDEPWPDFSEQELVSTCCGAGSCGGGYFSAFDYLTNRGIGSETDTPYVAKNTSCKKIPPKAKLKRWAYIQSPNTEKIKTAILQYGPVSCDIRATSSLQSYKSGIYNSCSSGSTNHMITIEGWNDEGQYWIMRNSWGKGWGMEGYGHIRYTSAGGSKCNSICSTAAFAELDPTFNGD